MKLYTNISEENTRVCLGRNILLKNLPCGEDVALCILDVTDVERSLVAFTGDNGTNTTQISSTSDHTEVS